MKSMIDEKISQAVRILKEKKIDMWLTFVRESATMADPAIDTIVGNHCTWQTAYIITAKGETIAIAGSLDTHNIKDHGHYKKVTGYVQGIEKDLLAAIRRIDPKKIAVNYSIDSIMADGLTHGMYLQLMRYLKKTPYARRIVSSEEIVAALRGRKSPGEIRRIKEAIRITLAIYDKVTGFLRPGVTERRVADFIVREAKAMGVKELAWDPDHCPAVFTGPDTAGAHAGPTNRTVKGGHILNIDFGVKKNGYCSDLQRTWYIRRKGEARAPKEVQQGFDVIRDSIRKAAAYLAPGRVNWKVDDAARSYITSFGYEEYPHALGHQVGRAAHDGGGILCPRWERYGTIPYGKVEADQVYTLEPRLTVPGYGVATIEEIVTVTPKGTVFLSKPQTKLFLV